MMERSLYLDQSHNLPVDNFPRNYSKSNRKLFSSTAPNFGDFSHSRKDDYVSLMNTYCCKETYQPNL